MTRRHLLGITLWRAPMAVAGGLLSSLAMPRENIWPLIFLSVFFILLSVRGLRFLSGAAVGFLGGLAFYLSQIEWLSLYLGPVPWLALSTLEAAIFAVGTGLIAMMFALAKGVKSARLRPISLGLSVAVIWTAREWVSTNLPYGGFPWSRVAQTLSDSYLAKWVYLVGISGLTFLVVLIVATSIGLFDRAPGKFVSSWPAAAVIALILLVPILDFVPKNAENGSLTIAAVQGNANAGLFANPERGTFLRNHLEASELLLEHPKRAKIDLIVWPENASDINPQTDEFAKLQLASVAKTFGVPIALGAITESGGSIFNSSLLYSATGEQLDQYDKKRPVPFAEYVPDRDFWYQLAPDLIGLVYRGYEFGTRDGIFQVEQSKLGVLICFEIAIDGIGRELVGEGAQLILSQTNNADFGRSDETFQQAALARLRAIETGRAIVNISTVGLSVIYLPNGEVLDQLPTFTPGVMVQEIPLRSSITPAIAIGAGFDVFLNLLALVLVTLAIRNRFERRFRSHAR